MHKAFIIIIFIIIINNRLSQLAAEKQKTRGQDERLWDQILLKAATSTLWTCNDTRWDHINSLTDYPFGHLLSVCKDILKLLSICGKRACNKIIRGIKIIQRFFLCVLNTEIVI